MSISEQILVSLGIQNTSKFLFHTQTKFHIQTNIYWERLDLIHAVGSSSAFTKVKNIWLICKISKYLQNCVSVCKIFEILQNLKLLKNFENFGTFLKFLENFEKFWKILKNFWKIFWNILWHFEKFWKLIFQSSQIMWNLIYTI